MSPNVLVVDSDSEAASALADMLVDLGCHVSYAFDPRLALMLARKCKPDIAFLDLRSGFQLAAAFRADTALAGCALVALSSPGSNDYPEASGTAGFQCFFSKPAGLQELGAAIERLMPAVEALR